LSWVLGTAGVAEAENRRQVEWKSDGPLDGGHLRAQTRDDRAGALCRIGALIVSLKPDHEEGLVGRWDVVDEIQSHHREHTFDARNRSDDLLDLLHNILGSIDRDSSLNT